MENVISYLDRLAGRRPMDFKAAFNNFSDLRRDVQQHLQLVYTTLAATVVAAAFGAWCDMFYYLGGMLSYLGTIAGVWYLTRTHASPSNVATRTWVLLGTGFCQGLSLGSLITPVFYFAPDLLFTAFLGTSAVFACFSGAAILSQRRSFLYLTATLSSIVSVMFTLRFASMFFASASAAVAGAELFIGLAVFIGYVLVDTQMIIERAHAGDKDHVRHAMDLFIDFAAIFARILVILLRNAQSAEQRRRDKQRREELSRYAHRR